MRHGRSTRGHHSWAAAIKTPLLLALLDFARRL